MEAVGVVLSGFELKRSRGDPIHAPGRFTVSLVVQQEDLLLVQQEDLLVAQQEDILVVQE